jgi:low temperature requirement protein LtrA
MERRTSPVELLWDLVFVFAITQVSTLLAHDLAWAPVGRAMLLLALVWWGWSAFVWAANAEGEDSRLLRTVLLLALVLMFIAGLSLPKAFADEAWVFVAAYSGVRLLHLGLYVEASRRGHASWSAIIGFGAATLAGLGLLAAGAGVHGNARVVLWAVAVAIDYAGPAWLTRERLRGLQEVAVAHFAERYGLFVIICLGESFVSIGITATGRSLDAGLIATVAFGLVVTVALWWIYFDRTATWAEDRLRAVDDPVLAAADSYSYLHLVIVAGIVVLAVGQKAAIAAPGSPLPAAARLALCGGVALYVAGHAAFRLRLGELPSIPDGAAVVALSLLVLASAHLDAWALCGLVAAVSVGLSGVMTLRHPEGSDPGAAPAAP